MCALNLLYVGCANLILCAQAYAEQKETVKVLQKDNEELKQQNTELNRRLALLVDKDRQVKRLGRELLEARQSISDWEFKVCAP